MKNNLVGLKKKLICETSIKARMVSADCVIRNSFRFWSPGPSRFAFEPNTYIPVIINDPLEGVVDYIASAPPDNRLSFSGSALPFASYEQALENTPNVGTINGVKTSVQFVIPILHPNSFYVGSDLVHPTLFLRYKTVNGRHVHIAVKVAKSAPFRTLYPPSAWYDGPTFFEKNQNAPVTTQERALLESAYPTF